MNITVLISMFLVILIIIRTLNNRREELIYKYKLFAIRDDLRYLAINGDVDNSTWIYNYIDGSLTKHIKSRRYITLFFILMLNIKHSGDNEIEELKGRIISELEKYPELNEIYNNFQSAHIEYIINQHSISIKFLLVPLSLPFALVSKLNNFINKSIFFPEITPTADNFGTA